MKKLYLLLICLIPTIAVFSYQEDVLRNFIHIKTLSDGITDFLIS